MKRIKTRKSIILEDVEDLVYAKIKNNRFKQQRLPAWRPVPTMGSIIIFYLALGLVFLILGTVILFVNKSVHQERVRYDNIDLIKINITKDMELPIMVYYQLVGVYQNHRRYLSSKNQDQLEGKILDTEDENELQGDTSCNSDNWKNIQLSKTISITENDLNQESAAYPCGLLAKDFFTDEFDEFVLFTKDNNSECHDGCDLTVSEKGIALEKDIKIYNNTIEDRSKFWQDVTDEHFLVWMRPAAFSDFKKLYARILPTKSITKIEKGSRIDIFLKNNEYDVSKIKGEKYIILSTVTSLGGDNTFLGVVYLIVAFISFLLAILFPVLFSFQQQKKEGEMKNKNPKKN